MHAAPSSGRQRNYLQRDAPYLLFTMLCVDQVGGSGHGRQLGDSRFHAAQPLVHVLAPVFELVRILQHRLELIFASRHRYRRLFPVVA